MEAVAGEQDASLDELFVVRAHLDQELWIGEGPFLFCPGVDLTMTMNRIFSPFGWEMDVSFDLEHNWLASADAFQLDLCQYVESG